MRQSQKTEQDSGRQRMVGLEGQEQAGVRSTASGERTVGDDVSFQAAVLSRGNLNEAYQQVRRNKGVAGIDGHDRLSSAPIFESASGRLYCRPAQWYVQAPTGQTGGNS